MQLRGIQKVFTLILLSFILVTNIRAQEEVNQDNDVETLEEKQAELEGTFQIEMIDTRALPTFNISLYDSIREMRDENEVVYLNVSDNMRIKILPTAVIESNSFQKVERVVYTTSK